MPEETPRIALVAVPDRLAGRLTETLRDGDFDVTIVDSAGECLRLVARGEVDGVVGGYALPDLDGVRLLRSIRVSHPGLPFILILESASPTITDEAVAAGVSGYVPADADPSTILARLQAALDRDAPWFSDEHQHRYRHLIEMAPIPINLFDDTGESIWCNDATLDLLGLDGRDELVGRSIFEFVHPDDHALARRELADVIERKESTGPTQMKLERPDGEVRYVQVSTAVGRFLGKDIGQAVVVDITPLREVQRALQDERRFIEKALDTLQDVFYVVDADGELLRWNQAVTDITGYDDELASMNVTTLFAESDRPRVLDSIGTVVEEGSDTIEATLVTKHGHTCPYEFRGRRLDGSDDGPQVVGIGRDISHRKERKRQLKALEQWLRHNIRNDVNVIHGTAENVREGRIGNVDEGIRRIERYADHLLEQADRERRIVEILTEPVDPVSIDLAELARRRIDALRERYPDADIDLTHADPVVVAAIPDLSAALDELIENAIEYADHEAPTVRVAVDDEGVRGVVHVVDDGPGIPDIERDTLDFDRDIDQLHHGSGLGLLFVYWVTRLSGGDMTVDGSDDGSTVTLAFPARRE
ncbi:PAS domain S-box protein [Haloplanus rubicundus]|uniref:histidine kinase n=1 Tax=Haloplanus rubicundus TaxID=1547898 RepID=A0A345E345_9EURY|nr:PAS domain S-box protein [Haloplanus rubicundus]AXG06617.1 PAS domain S-box protein [Haloplanus rubicundus]AXG09992.1 PAS domain S-box protein [Haloplanus rubicundus]